MLDYWICSQRWKNSIGNVFSDTSNAIDSDHFPLMAEVRLRLKGSYPQPVRKKGRVTPQQVAKINEILDSQRPQVSVN